MSEVSIFCDESGTDGGHSTYRLVTLVFHDQSQELGDLIACYERALDVEGLPHIAFHCSPIMYGTGMPDLVTESWVVRRCVVG